MHFFTSLPTHLLAIDANVLHFAAGMAGGDVGHVVLTTDRGISHIIAGTGGVTCCSVVQRTIVNIHNDGTLVVRATDEGVGHYAGNHQNGTNDIPSGHVTRPRLISRDNEAGQQHSNGGEGQGDGTSDHARGSR